MDVVQLKLLAGFISGQGGVTLLIVQHLINTGVINREALNAYLDRAIAEYEAQKVDEAVLSAARNLRKALVTDQDLPRFH